MAIKNYLVSSIFDIKTTQWAWTDRANERDIKTSYQRMYDVSLSTFKHFLAGEYEVKFWTGEVEHPTFVARKNWDLIRELWHNEPCNILWHGPDTQMIKPTDIFDKYKNFELFSYTDPKSFGDVPHYFNNDIRYFPATMNPAVWELGDELVKNWNTSNTDHGWNYEQVMHNKMFWSQGYTIDTALRPDIVYQAQWLPNTQQVKEQQDVWNGGKLEDAHIIHWHGSRNAELKLSAMRDVAQQTGVIL